MLRILFTLSIIAPLIVLSQSTCSNPWGSSKFISAPPPNHQYLIDSGYCYTFSPTLTSFTRCFTIIPGCDSIVVNSGWSNQGCINVSFSTFEFYTYPACTLISTGLNLGGLVAGDTIVWCMSGSSWGGPNCNNVGSGFQDICPYFEDFCTNPLPITLIDFYGRDNNEKVELEWSVLNEINNYRFIIEKTIDGSSYEPIGYVIGAGTSYSKQDYSYVDDNPNEGINYYRLSQEDYDGSIEHHKNIAVDVKYGIHTYKVYDSIGRLILVTENKQKLNTLPKNKIYFILDNNLVSKVYIK